MINALNQWEHSIPREEWEQLIHRLRTVNGSIKENIYPPVLKRIKLRSILIPYPSWVAEPSAGRSCLLMESPARLASPSSRNSVITEKGAGWKGGRFERMR